ncbi:MAG TPA: Gfo/Idh/MocA family oxidoreductase [Terriglobia bacterium]|nr:Gfo/Idh/MocA family oxidoreductase [Terriglobia bacterium]
MPDSSKIARRDFIFGSVAGAANLAVPSPSIASTSRKFRYGIVGSGYRSRGAHLKILHDYVHEVEIVALCDITPENLKEGLQNCGPATVGYSDYRQMLAQHPELDAVVVVVPNYKHSEVAIAALEAGKHVLTEKPMASHLADADRMMRAADEHGKILQVGFQRRYSNSFQRMHDLIHQGMIGNVAYVFASLFRGDWNPRSWKYTDPKTGESTN